MYLKQINKLGKAHMQSINEFQELTDALKIKLPNGKDKFIALPIIGETVEIWDGDKCHFRSDGGELGRTAYYDLYESTFESKKATYVREGKIHESKAFKEWFQQEVNKKE